MSSQDKEQKESLVSRWSRRKQEARERPQQTSPRRAEDKPLPDLPPVDKLSIESDFTGFMDARVDDAVRRIALKKLFGDPRFNVRDGLDDYAENYAALEDLTAEMVEQLQHARRTLRGAETEEGETPETQTDEQHIEPPADAAPLAQADSAQDEGLPAKDHNEPNQGSS